MEITRVDIIGPGVGIGQPEGGSNFALAGILLGTVLIRLIGLDQPIVENYVGRQVPTAMVARNLERGSGFLRPQLDTAPFPNYFVVEPPVYQLAVVSWQRLLGWKLEASGRFVSAAAMALGVWALFGLVRRREDAPTALAAIIAFSLFPITLRYGRAFQPDALMLGAVSCGPGLLGSRRAGPRPLVAASGVALASSGTGRQGYGGLRPGSSGRRDCEAPEHCQDAPGGLRPGAGAPLVCLGQSSGRFRRRLAGLGGESGDLDGRVRCLRPGSPGHAGAHRSIPARPGLHPTGADSGRLGALLEAGGTR